MAYCVHGDVSDHLLVAAYTASSTPTQAQITAAIADADIMIDNYIQGATIPATTLKICSVMIVAGMLHRSRRSLVESEEALELGPPLMTSEIKAMLDRDMAAAGEIPIIVSNQPGYQTSDNPDDFV